MSYIYYDVETGITPKNDENDIVILVPVRGNKVKLDQVRITGRYYQVAFVSPGVLKTMLAVSLDGHREIDDLLKINIDPSTNEYRFCPECGAEVTEKSECWSHGKVWPGGEL